MSKYSINEDSEEQESSHPSGIPSYLIAADIHNAGNGNESFLGDPAAKIGNVGKFLTASVISGGSQLYNIFPSIGNVFGGDYELNKPEDVMEQLDSNLTDYYKENKQFADIGGFFISSLLPGMGGVKLLNAGQAALKGAVVSGKLGKNMAGAVNLLAPSQPTLLKAAIESAVSPNAAQAVWNPNTLRAVAASVTQNTLEGVAFTTAVEATMFASPVLDSQDIGDIASNILWGGLLQGGIGGGIGTAGIAHKIYSKLRSVAKESSPYTHRALLADSSPASSKILTYLDDAATTPVPGKDAEYYSKFLAQRETKVRNIEVDVRKEFGVLTGGDQELATVLHNWQKSVPNATVVDTLFGTSTAVRLSVKTDQEKALQAIAGKAEPTSEEIALFRNTSVSYIKNWGEDAGMVFSNAPKVFNLADTVRPGKTFESVLGSYDTKLKIAWNPLETSGLEAEARYIAAMKGKINPTAPIAHNDLPYLQAAMEQGHLPQITAADGSVWTPNTLLELRNYILQSKEVIAAKLASKKVHAAEISKIVDSTADWLSGTRLAEDKNAFGLAFFADSYTQRLKTAGVISDKVDRIPVWELPSYTKRVQDLTPILGVDGMVLDGMTAIMQKQKLYAQQAGVIADSILHADVKFSPISQKVLLTANPRGPGGSAISSMNENYGQLGSVMQYNGQQTLKAIASAEKGFDEVSQPILYKALSKPESLQEFSVLNNKLAQIPEQYMLSPDGSANLILVKEFKYQQAIDAGVDVPRPSIAEDVPTVIPIKNQETYDLVALHIQENGKNVDNLSKIRSQQGLAFDRDSSAFYPIPRDPRNFKFFAFVVDDSITGSFGRNKMVHATSAADLEAKITELKSLNPSLKILTGKDATNYYESIGQYEYERTLTDVTFDSTKTRTGRGADILPMTDPQKIAEQFIGWHKARKANGIREAVLLKFEPQVSTLNALASNFSSISRSHYTAMDSLSYVQNMKGNPYSDYTKTLLGLSTAQDYPIYTALNELLDRKISGLFKSVEETFYSAKTPAELDVINARLIEYGYEGPAYSALANVLANHTAPKAVVSNFVRKANSILATVMLRLDPINALNNLMGSNVLLSAELKHVLSQIDPDAVGELAHINVPGTTDSIFSMQKLIAKSMARFHSEEGKLLRAEYAKRGYITKLTDQYLETIDGLAPRLTDSAEQLTGRIDKTFAKLKSYANTGEKLTGNKFAEEFNRFVAADIMRQLTDKVVQAGKMSSDEAWAYINTFVNRTQGNYIASQRPGMFSGPIGQAIGLFQTYQFNFLQQLFRYVGNGELKTTSTLLGMQSAIYGMNGLPGFNAVNTYIVGNAAGNTRHTDLVDTVYGSAGKSAADWLLYGVGSNVWGLIHPDLKLNLYTRGDVNPRHLTVVPTSLEDVPFISASTKLFGSMSKTFSNIAGGGNVWNSFLQGIEHAGVNRPLAGLAQALQATGNPYGLSYSTSSKGNVVVANDLWTLANLTRIAGAKPFDEALARDRAYTLSVYAAKDSELRKELGSAIKTAVQAGNTVTEDQIFKFSARYAAAGGKQENFNKFFMEQFVAANTSQVNEIVSHLGKPSAQSMQRILGGMAVKDLTSE